ncbi:dihydroneopterin aldolase [Sulfurospirillum sp. 1307]|jgi:dihydroneopterin aldolase
MTIYIENLTFDTIIGILPEEREVPQKVVVNCKIKYKYKNNKFINYVEIANLIEETIKEEKFLLIEDAILSILKKIKSNFKNITSIKLKISKPQILDKCDVCVEKYKKY